MKRLPLAVLVGTHLVNDFYGGAVAAMVPFFVLERHYTYAAATGLMLAATFASTLIQPAFGVLTDRHRLGWLVGGGMLVCGLGVSAAGVPHSYVLTWLAIAVSGVGSAAFHPEASRATRSIAGASAIGMSIFSVGGNIGMAVAPVTVAAVLALTTLSGSPALVVPAVLMAAAGMLLPRLAGRAGHAGRAAVPQERPASATPAARPPQPARRDDWRMFGWLAGAVIALSIALVGLRSFLPLYLIQRFGVSPVIGSAALTVAVGVGVSGTLLGGVLADRWGRVPTVRLGYALTGPALVGLVVAPTLPIAFVAAVVLGVALYLPFSIHVTLGQEYLPNRVGTAAGLTLGMSISAGGLASPLLGALADVHGVAAALLVLAGLALLALLLSTRFHETRERAAARA